MIHPTLHRSATTYLAPKHLSLFAALAAWGLIGARGNQKPASRTTQSRHGNLAGITDSERRPLRPIGTTADAVAMKTDRVLSQLLAIPGVQIFCSLGSANPKIPVVTHAISSGRLLLLVESVAWPPGDYHIDHQRRVCCDGVYIGQSVGPLTAAVDHWRSTLHRGHQISAMVVVHHCPPAQLRLPDAESGTLSWTLLDDAVAKIRRLIPAEPRRRASRHTLTTLMAATASS